jgi:hypothetical protein
MAECYFVFMCFNFSFIPVVYFTSVETNGYSLEKLDAIFPEACEKNENPVFTERRIRWGRPLDVEKRDEVGVGDAEHKERSRSESGDVQAEKFDPEGLEMMRVVGLMGDSSAIEIRSFEDIEPPRGRRCSWRLPSAVTCHQHPTVCFFFSHGRNDGNYPENSRGLKNQTSEFKSPVGGCWNRLATGKVSQQQVVRHVLILVIEPERIDFLTFSKISSLRTVLRPNRIQLLLSACWNPPEENSLTCTAAKARHNRSHNRRVGASILGLDWDHKVNFHLIKLTTFYFLSGTLLRKSSVGLPKPFTTDLGLLSLIFLSGSIFVRIFSPV